MWIHNPRVELLKEREVVETLHVAEHLMSPWSPEDYYLFKDTRGFCIGTGSVYLRTLECQVWSYQVGSGGGALAFFSAGSPL